MVLVDSAHEDFLRPSTPHTSRAAYGSLGIPPRSGSLLSLRSNIRSSFRYRQHIGHCYQYKISEYVRRDGRRLTKAGVRPGIQNNVSDRTPRSSLRRFKHELFLVFRKNQMELAQKSTQGQTEHCRKRGHHIQHDQPEVWLMRSAKWWNAVRAQNYRRLRLRLHRSVVQRASQTCREIVA